MSVMPALGDRLHTETVVWLGSVRPDGQPHLLPLWFTWDDTAIAVVGKPHSQKIRNVRCNPRVIVAVGDAGVRLRTVLVEGRAREMPARDLTDVAMGRLHRYDGALAEFGLTLADFLAIYSSCLRVEPRRVLDWGAAPVARPTHIGAMARSGAPFALATARR